MNDEDRKLLEDFVKEFRYDYTSLAQAIENLLRENKQLELDEKEKEVVEAYRNIKKISGSDSWIVCNPETMWSEYFVPVAKIKEKIKELDKEEKQQLKGTKGQDRYAIKQEFMYKRNILQELLEVK